MRSAERTVAAGLDRASNALAVTVAASSRNAEIAARCIRAYVTGVNAVAASIAPTNDARIKVNGTGCTGSSRASTLAYAVLAGLSGEARILTAGCPIRI